MGPTGRGGLPSASRFSGRNRDTPSLGRALRAFSTSSRGVPSRMCDSRCAAPKLALGEQLQQSASHLRNPV
ncbi:hypothetical protein HPB47_008743 [Ixodes persulcatus]|uniref:Uncharacterized protein n=1 Tax=Ixodes persulcatus TaxID=34615 RepID=A0AC60P3X7_IXOPE|nr:hypothetical protein HPB47_008743 [Ixodes persulcatus]